MYGRAGFALLRHRILLGLRNVTTGSERAVAPAHLLDALPQVGTL